MAEEGIAVAAIEPEFPKSFEDLQYVAISSVSESTDLQSSYVTGVVSLFWPYSSSSHEFSVLLSDSDILERINKGEMKLTFRGKSLGKNLEKQLQIGNTVKIALRAAKVYRNEDANKSDADSDWGCVWENSVMLQVNDSEITVATADPEMDLADSTLLSISPDLQDEPDPDESDSNHESMEPEIINSNRSSMTPAKRPAESLADASNTWFTPPIVLRRPLEPAPDDSFTSGAMFEFEDELSGPLPKRSKHSRSSSDYVFDDGSNLAASERELQDSVWPNESVSPTAPAPETIGEPTIGDAPSQSPTNFFGSAAASEAAHSVDVNNTHLPAGPPDTKLLRDENELYRDLMRRKSNAVEIASHAAQQPTREAAGIIDDVSVATQVGSFADAESSLGNNIEDQRDRETDNLMAAQSNLYNEILREKISNSSSKTGVESSAVTQLGSADESRDQLGDYASAGTLAFESAAMPSTEISRDPEHALEQVESTVLPEEEEAPHIAIESSIEPDDNENMLAFPSEDVTPLASAMISQSEPADVQMSGVAGPAPAFNLEGNDQRKPLEAIYPSGFNQSQISAATDSQPSLATTQAIDSQQESSIHHVELEEVPDETNIPERPGNDELDSFDVQQTGSSGANHPDVVEVRHEDGAPADISMNTPLVEIVHTPAVNDDMDDDELDPSLFPSIDPAHESDIAEAYDEDDGPLIEAPPDDETSASLRPTEEMVIIIDQKLVVYADDSDDHSDTVGVVIEVFDEEESAIANTPLVEIVHSPSLDFEEDDLEIDPSLFPLIEPADDADIVIEYDEDDGPLIEMPVDDVLSYVPLETEFVIIIDRESVVYVESEEVLDTTVLVDERVSISTSQLLVNDNEQLSVSFGGAPAESLQEEADSPENFATQLPGSEPDTQEFQAGDMVVEVNSEYVEIDSTRIVDDADSGGMENLSAMQSIEKTLEFLDEESRQLSGTAKKYEQGSTSYDQSVNFTQVSETRMEISQPEPSDNVEILASSSYEVIERLISENDSQQIDETPPEKSAKNSEVSTFTIAEESVRALSQPDNLSREESQDRMDVDEVESDAEYASQRAYSSEPESDTEKMNWSPAVPEEQSVQVESSDSEKSEEIEVSVTTHIVESSVVSSQTGAGPESAVLIVDEEEDVEVVESDKAEEEEHGDDEAGDVAPELAENAERSQNPKELEISKANAASIEILDVEGSEVSDEEEISDTAPEWAEAERILLQRKKAGGTAVTADEQLTQEKTEQVSISSQAVEAVLADEETGEQEDEDIDDNAPEWAEAERIIHGQSKTDEKTGDNDNESEVEVDTEDEIDDNAPEWAEAERIIHGQSKTDEKTGDDDNESEVEVDTEDEIDDNAPEWAEAERIIHGQSKTDKKTGDDDNEPEVEEESEDEIDDNAPEWAEAERIILGQSKEVPLVLTESSETSRTDTAKASSVEETQDEDDDSESLVSENDEDPEVARLRDLEKQVIAASQVITDKDDDSAEKEAEDEDEDEEMIDDKEEKRLLDLEKLAEAATNAEDDEESTDENSNDGEFATDYRSYTQLSELRVGYSFHIIAVITGVSLPTPSEYSDDEDSSSKLTLKLMDSSILGEPKAAAQVVIHGRHRSGEINVGDVIILQNFKCSLFKGIETLVVRTTSSWVVLSFPGNKSPIVIYSNRPLEYGPQEIEYAKKAKQAFDEAVTS
ncbi:hypothetical protein BZA70DRAFT_266835 [Myxozyma melibiosi]|uniref:Telomeric single stranded DNA binding POT1/Cdc13 domain-containing protein n=1 Tax=Myxozyma melibiosi TaxID=54550 RepID=A0ABR1F7G5_9ASCO